MICWAGVNIHVVYPRVRTGSCQENKILDNSKKQPERHCIFAKSEEKKFSYHDPV